MKLERPIITSDRYSNLNSNDKRREYQRDLAIYEQAQLLEQLANQKQEISVNVDNDLNEDYIEAIKEQNELLQDQLILQNLKGKDRKEYLKKLQEKAEEKEKLKEAEIKVHNIYRRGEELESLMDDFTLEIEEATADKQIKNIKKQQKILDTTKSGLDTFAVWFFILIFGGVGLGVYSTVVDSRGFEFNKLFVVIYILALILYPIISLTTNKSKSNNIDKLDKEYKNTESAYKKEVIKFRNYVKDIQVDNAIEEYKKYITEYVKDIQEKYLRNKKDFKDLDEDIFRITLNEIAEI